MGDPPTPSSAGNRLEGAALPGGLQTCGSAQRGGAATPPAGTADPASLMARDEHVTRWNASLTGNRRGLRAFPAMLTEPD